MEFDLGREFPTEAAGFVAPAFVGPGHDVLLPTGDNGPLLLDYDDASLPMSRFGFVSS